MIASQGPLTRLLVRVMEVTSGLRGLLNIWRARWMSLATSTELTGGTAAAPRSQKELMVLRPRPALRIACSQSLTCSPDADGAAIASHSHMCVLSTFDLITRELTSSNALMLSSSEQTPVKSPVVPLTVGPDLGRHNNARMDIVGYSQQRLDKASATTPNARHSFNGTDVDLDFSSPSTPSGVSMKYTLAYYHKQRKTLGGSVWMFASPSRHEFAPGRQDR
ncbi:hypothetical protein EDD22DRAFT_1007275 [Suillus occidentalis]|nr:hypothetical protein EDD22DRAFT_1007275 [Suillus occidentalis]